MAKPFFLLSPAGNFDFRTALIQIPTFLCTKPNAEIIVQFCKQFELNEHQSSPFELSSATINYDWPLKQFSKSKGNSGLTLNYVWLMKRASTLGGSIGRSKFTGYLT